MKSPGLFIKGPFTYRAHKRLSGDAHFLKIFISSIEVFLGIMDQNLFVEENMDENSDFADEVIQFCCA